MTASQTLARLGLGGALVFAGIGHLTFAREDFRAQVPRWVPLSEDATVLASGAVEIALGVAIASGIGRKRVGRFAAAFFVAVFPGNLSQWRNHRDAFGLDTDLTRLLRLPMQVPLIAMALWSTGALDG